MQPLLLVQPPIEHSRAQLEDLADRLIVGARLRPRRWTMPKRSPRSSFFLVSGFGSGAYSAKLFPLNFD